MNEFLNLLQDIFMMKKEDSLKIGLTQFKREVVRPLPKDVSIKNKNVKLSDLMRRVS